MSNGDMATYIAYNEYDLSINGINDVHMLSCDTFRKKLVNHSDILFKQNKVVWPCSSKI